MANWKGERVRTLFVAGSCVALGVIGASWLRPLPFRGILVGPLEGVAGATTEMRGLGIGIGRLAPRHEVRVIGRESRTIIPLEGISQSLLFVTGSCPYCKELEAKLSAGEIELASRVIILYDGWMDDAKLLSGALEGRVDVALDSGGVIARAYGVATVPSAYLVGHDGRVIAGVTGLPRVSRLLAARP